MVRKGSMVLGVALAVVVLAPTLPRAEGTAAKAAAVAARHEGTASDHGAHCAVAPDPDCGVCAVSCAVGQAAVCMPGRLRTIDPRGGRECYKAPVCRCDAAAQQAAKQGAVAVPDNG